MSLSKILKKEWSLWKSFNGNQCVTLVPHDYFSNFVKLFEELAHIYQECPVCYCYGELIKFHCGHLLCYNCYCSLTIVGQRQLTKKCPMCRASLVDLSLIGRVEKEHPIPNYFRISNLCSEIFEPGFSSPLFAYSPSGMLHDMSSPFISLYPTLNGDFDGTNLYPYPRAISHFGSIVYPPNRGVYST